MNKIIKIALTTGLLVGSVATTQACSLGAWDAAPGAVAGGPNIPPTGSDFSRYSGACAMNGIAGSVLNNFTSATSGPSAESEMVVRFYFMPVGTGTSTIFQTYAENAATTPIYTITYDSTTGVTVTPNDAGAGAPKTVAVGAAAWHSIEVHWTAGGNIDIWVDSDAATVAANDTTTSGSAASVINAGKLGGITVPGTMTDLLFDSYESRRTTAIGRIVPGDAAAPMDGVVNVTDVQAVIDEILGTTSANLAGGMPNCNEDSTPSTNVQDVQCIVDIILP